jgi:hypothetical protein
VEHLHAVAELSQLLRDFAGDFSADIDGGAEADLL